MGNFPKEMNALYHKGRNSLDNSYDAVLLMDNDFRTFLDRFFFGDVNKNLFLTHVFYEGDESIYSFQLHLFEATCKFLDELLRIEGLSFSFDASVPLSSVDMVISDTRIASINIFHKQLTLFEKVFFENIDSSMSEKEAEKIKLEKEHSKILSSINRGGFYTKVNRREAILRSTILKKKYMKQQFMMAEDVQCRILEIDNEISELMITRQLLVRNLTNIKYFQDKIHSRISSNLHYNISLH